jgi:hypothetical protein
MYNLLKQQSRIHDLILEKQNTSTGCTGISNFIPIYIMCIHEYTLQRHFCRKKFMNATPVRQTQIKPSYMSMCKWALHSGTSNATFCSETKFPTQNTFYKYRINYVFLSHTVCHNKTLCNRFGILHNMYAFKLYATCIKCACKSFHTAVYKYVIDYTCKMKNAQITWQWIVQFWNVVDAIFLYLQSKVSWHISSDRNTCRLLHKPTNMSVAF